MVTETAFSMLCSVHKSCWKMKSTSPQSLSAEGSNNSIWLFWQWGSGNTRPNQYIKIYVSITSLFFRLNLVRVESILLCDIHNLWWQRRWYELLPDSTSSVTTTIRPSTLHPTEHLRRHVNKWELFHIQSDESTHQRPRTSSPAVAFKIWSQAIVCFALAHWNPARSRFAIAIISNGKKKVKKILVFKLN